LISVAEQLPHICSTPNQKKHMLRLFTSTTLLALSLSAASQVENAKVRALVESSKPAEGKGNLNCGAYQSMEAIRHGAIPGLRGVKLRLEQPVCSGQSANLFMANEIGEPWTYKVIDRKGPLVTQGSAGYTRQIGNLRPGAYLIQFVHANGTSVVDEFVVKEGKEIQLDVEVVNNQPLNGANQVELKATAIAGMEYEWQFGDGASAFEGNIVKYVYSQPGTYKITCSAGNFDCKTEKNIEIVLHGPAALADQKD
jgi:hypothetical protein